jgi:hypothetical protein
LLSGEEAKYVFANYAFKRYNLKNLSAELIKGPPVHLRDHKNSREVLNYILDKAFVE